MAPNLLIKISPFMLSGKKPALPGFQPETLPLSGTRTCLIHAAGMNNDAADIADPSSMQDDGYT